MLQTNYESKTEFYCTNCTEKDQHIKELEKENKDIKKNILGQDKEIKRLIDVWEKSLQELALYKKALENEMQKKAEELNQSLGVMGASQLNYEDLIESVLKQAKEEIDEQKASEKERKE